MGLSRLFGGPRSPGASEGKDVSPETTASSILHTAGIAASSLTADLLFRRHGKDVVRIVRRLVGPRASQADVDDLVQQVFIAVHKDVSRFRGESQVTTWLYGIASRTVLMYFRSGRRRQRAMEAFAEESRATEELAPSAERGYANKQELERVMRALERVRPKKRVVFILHEVEGLSGKEIASALEINEATVWTRLFHARRELVAALRKERER
jgi:RNA polymerase sigma-70 factor (ECF subfamily)